MLKENEKATERYLKDQIQKIGGKSYKWESQNNKGVPDRICILPSGVIFFIEVKSENCKPTKLQEFVHNEMRALGCFVFVVDRKETVNRILEEFS